MGLTERGRVREGERQREREREKREGEIGKREIERDREWEGPERERNDVICNYYVQEVTHRQNPTTECSAVLSRKYA